MRMTMSPSGVDLPRKKFFTNKVGDDIIEPLAQALQMILLGLDDKKILMIIHDNNARSGKVTGLIVSELSKEVDITENHCLS